MEGGNLEIMNHDKHHALDLLAEGKPYNAEVVGYEKPGKMILAQGSEILHHVTPVTNIMTRYLIESGSISNWMKMLNFWISECPSSLPTLLQIPFNHPRPF